MQQAVTGVEGLSWAALMPCCVRTMPKSYLTPWWPRKRAGFPGLEAEVSISMVRAGRVNVGQCGMQGCRKIVPVGKAVPEEHSDIQNRFFFLKSCFEENHSRWHNSFLTLDTASPEP